MSDEQQQQQPVDKRTATQKIADLEAAVMELYQTIQIMGRDLSIAKDAIKLLGNKLDSVVQAAATGQPINDETVAKLMVSNNVEELKQKVSNLVAQGFLQPSETVPENAFVVGREENDKGETVNPRLQFSLSALENEDFRNKIKAAKIGDVINLQEDKLRFVLLEVYAIVAAQAVPAQEQTPASTASAETAPAQEQATPAATTPSESAAN